MDICDCIYKEIYYKMKRLNLPREVRMKFITRDMRARKQNSYVKETGMSVLGGIVDDLVFEEMDDFETICKRIRHEFERYEKASF